MPVGPGYQVPLSEAVRRGAQIATAAGNGGLPARYLKNSGELRQLTAFFAWTAWASVANRPGKPYSYTNNFPYDPDAGNLPTPGAYLWSALSLVALLGGTAAVLFAFVHQRRRVPPFIGWRSVGDQKNPRTVIRDAVLLVLCLALAQHIERLFNRLSHRRFAGRVEIRREKNVGQLKVGKDAHRPKGQQRNFHAFGGQ